MVIPAQGGEIIGIHGRAVPALSDVMWLQSVPFPASISVEKLALELVELGPPAGVHEYGFLAALHGFDKCIEHMFDSTERV